MKKYFLFIISLTFFYNYLFSQNVGINTTGAAPAATNMLEVLNPSTTASSVGIYSLHSGAITGTGYGIWAEKTGASTTNIAGYFSASGATNNYAIIVPSGGGKIGIGTTTPSTFGTDGINIAGTTPTIDFNSTSAASYSALVFKESGTFKADLVYLNSSSATVSDRNTFNLVGATGVSIRFFENNTENMTIKTGGNVGIGTGTGGTPEARLEVQNTEGNDASLALDADDGDDNADTWFIKSQAADNDLTFTNHATELIKFTDAGSVGIGDSSPDHKLDVAGNIGMDASSYVNFGDTDGSSGYGIRDNSGSIEYKNSGGSWNAILPPGIVMPYAAASAPSGWLICDGSAVSRATYATLFALIGATYGAGDGATTFNLPDLRGRVPVGVGTGTYKSAGILHANGDNLTARTLGEYDGAEYPSGYPVGTGQNSDEPYAIYPGTTPSSTYSSTADGNSGDNTEGGNMQPYIGLTYIIKY